MVAVDDVEAPRLPAILAGVRACGARGAAVDRKRARTIEPMITPRCRGAIHLPDDGIIDPIRFTVALARLAAVNGAEIHRSMPMTGVEPGDGDITRVETANATLRTRFVVNAAGHAAGEVSRLAGGEPSDMWPRKGQYAVLDREFGHRLRSIVFSTPLPGTKGVSVVPTTHGSCLVGPTANDHDDPWDCATDAVTVASLRAAVARLVPEVSEVVPIKNFAANRPTSDESVRLRFDKRNPRLLHATNRSTGVSTAPAAAETGLDLLRGAGLDATGRGDATTVLPAIPRLRTAAHPERLDRDRPRVRPGRVRL